jgi:carbamoyl-phosphate synthase large subunit
MNILITSAGRRVSLVRAFQKELRAIDSGGLVLTTDANPVLSSACNVSDGAFKVPKFDSPDYINALLDICKTNEISLLIPCHDAQLKILALNRDKFANIGTKLILSSLEFVEKCRDKRLIHQFFESKGVTVATEYEKDDYKLPLFIKPSDGTRSIDTYLIRKKEELKDHHFENPKMMFLEYLDHALYDEYTCDLYYSRSHTLKCVVPRKRIEVREGEVNKGVTVKNELVDVIKNHLGEIEGAIGCLTAQFFKHKFENKTYGIEINPRFGGGYPLSYLAGANFPKWILAEYLLAEEIDEKFDCWESDLLMLRYDDEILVHGYKG